jgi:hypothetical protein
MIGSDDINRSDCKRHSVVLQMLLAQHAVQAGDLAIRVGDDGEVHYSITNSIDICNPASMVDSGVDGQGQHLRVAISKFLLQLGDAAQLSGAHGRVVTRVGEQDSPSAAHIIIKVDLAGGSVGVEVGRRIAQTDYVLLEVSILALQQQQQGASRVSQIGQRRNEHR